jgi:hypothetical protein
MSRGSRRAKHRAKQQAAAQSREHARRSSSDQRKQYTEDDPLPDFGFGFFSYAPGYEPHSQPEYVVPPVPPPATSGADYDAVDATIIEPIVKTSVFICMIAVFWLLGRTMCMWAAVGALILWLARGIADARRQSKFWASKQKDGRFEFDTEEEAARFIQFLLSLHAIGGLSKKELAAMLEKYRAAGMPPGMPEPCICEDCR